MKIHSGIISGFGIELAGVCFVLGGRAVVGAIAMAVGGYILGWMEREINRGQAEVKAG